MTNICYNLNRICLAYGKNRILNDISVSLPQEKFTAIVGENGSGKSTLLQILLNQLKASTGDINFYEKDLSLWNRKKLAQQIAYVPQNFPRDIQLSVEEIVSFGRTPWNNAFGFLSSKDKEIIHVALEKTGLIKLKNKKLTELSGGEAQRVFIARALAQTPCVLLLDEPTAQLDYKHQAMLMHILLQELEKKTTVVMVSHDINLMAQYADYILLLKKGNILDFGEPQKILSKEKLKELYDCDFTIKEQQLSPIILPL